MFFSPNTQPYIRIENWSYRLTREEDGRLRRWHHVTPADDGYGAEVDLHLPADYFQTHSVKDFYRFVTTKHCSPAPQYVDKAAEIKELKKQFREQGWLAD